MTYMDSGLRGHIELTILDLTGDLDFAARVGNCVDMLLKEGILKGSESAAGAIDEIILQAIAEGG